MIKLLQCSFIVLFSLIVNSTYAQSTSILNHSHHEQEHIFLSHSEPLFLQNQISKDLKVFSYNIVVNIEDYHLDHDHTSKVTLLDILTSEEGSDFNCSGGFCMNKSHFHKKGLTLKKQLFDYFMNITC